MTTRAANIQFLLAGMSNPTTGLPVAGGTVYFYEAGTSTQKYVWTEIAKTNGYYSASLDAVGAVQLYGEGNYKIVVKDSAGATVYTLDNVRLEYPYYGIRSVTQTGNQLSQDDFLLVDTSGGAVTINCLAAASWLRPLKIQRIAGSASITVDPSSTETIDGASTLTISSNAIVEIISDGSNLRSAGFRSSFADADNDTLIQVEESADEDKIRFDTGGTERLILDSTGAHLDVNLEFTQATGRVITDSTEGNLIVSGGPSNDSGGQMFLYGSAHGSSPGTLKLVTGLNDRVSINSSGDISGSVILDEDDMVSNSAVRLATQQSIKAYVDSGTVTMTNKTLTSPAITDPTITGTVTLGGTVLAATTAEINTACDGITATAAELNTGCDGISNPPVAGDSTAGRVLRRINVMIANGTNASTLKIYTASNWNGDTIGETDNISGGAVGNFYYNSAENTHVCRILASGLTGNCVAVLSAEIGHQYTTTPLTVIGSATGNNIYLYFYNEDNGANPTLDVLVDTGYIQLYVTYVTDA